MRSVLFPALLAAATVQQPECGPTSQDIGRAVLVAQPAVFALGLGLLALVLVVWRGREVAARWRWPPQLALALALTALAGAVALWDVDPELVLAALWLYGASYATVLLLAARALLAWAPERAFAFASLAPLAAFGLPAALLAGGLVEHESLTGWAVDLFVLPGYGGPVPAVLLLLVLGEGLLRRRRAARSLTR